ARTARGTNLSVGARLLLYKRRAALGTDATSVGPTLSQREREHRNAFVRDVRGPLRWLRTCGTRCGIGSGGRRPRAHRRERAGKGAGAAPAARATAVGSGRDAGHNRSAKGGRDQAAVVRAGGGRFPDPRLQRAGRRSGNRETRSPVPLSTRTGAR